MRLITNTHTSTAAPSIQSLLCIAVNYSIYYHISSMSHNTHSHFSYAYFRFTSRSMQNTIAPLLPVYWHPKIHANRRNGDRCKLLWMKIIEIYGYFRFSLWHFMFSKLPVLNDKVTVKEILPWFLFKALHNEWHDHNKRNPAMFLHNLKLVLCFLMAFFAFYSNAIRNWFLKKNGRKKHTLTTAYEQNRNFECFILHWMIGQRNFQST